MLRRRVFRRVRCHLQQLHLDLKRCVAEQAQKLRFSVYFGRHDIYYSYPQRAYILMKCPVLGHYKHVFRFKRSCSRQTVRNFNWHLIVASMRII